ncbi:single-stranded DNA-binding protein [Candidatus Falkowbacteria bacterium]|nr:single-stranded DNA-binding protein [Candidatus Falkowbacteria bacterium]
MTLNKALIIGNVTRDPELRTTPQGIAVTTFGVATNMRWTDASGQKQEKAEFHNVVAWRKLAETCAQYLRRGSKVYIEGRLQTREWDAQDGTKKQRTEIIAENMIMLDRPGAGQSTGSASRFTPPTAAGQASADVPTITTDVPTSQPPVEAGATEDIKIENIPF